MWFRRLPFLGHRPTIIFFLIITASALFYFRSYQRAGIPNPTLSSGALSTTSTHQLSEPQSEQPCGTLFQWRFYKDPEYGFSLCYPSEFSQFFNLTESNIYAVEFLTPRNNNLKHVLMAINIEIPPQISNTTLEGWIGTYWRGLGIEDMNKKKAIMVGGVPGYMYWDEDRVQGNIRSFVEYKGKFYMIAYSYSIPPNNPEHLSYEQALSLFDQINATFKFE